MKLALLVVALILGAQSVASAQTAAVQQALAACLRHVDVTTKTGFQPGFESCVKIKAAYDSAQAAADQEVVAGAAAGLP